MASEHSAAEVLRARIAAMCEHDRTTPWTVEDDGLVWADGRPGDPVFGSADPDTCAYLAGWHPTVGLALAELLDAIRALDEAWRRTDGHGNAVIRMSAVGDLLERRDALEAAVLGSGT